MGNHWRNSFCHMLPGAGVKCFQWVWRIGKIALLHFLQWCKNSAPKRENIFIACQYWNAIRINKHYCKQRPAAVQNFFSAPIPRRTHNTKKKPLAAALVVTPHCMHWSCMPRRLITLDNWKNWKDLPVFSALIFTVWRAIPNKSRSSKNHRPFPLRCHLVTKP